MIYNDTVHLRIDGVIRPLSINRIRLSRSDDFLCVIQHESSKNNQTSICNN